MRRGREFEIRGAEQRKVRILYRLLGHWRNSEVWEQFVQYMTSFIVIVPIKWKKKTEDVFFNCSRLKTATKVKVMKSMVWAVFQYGVEGWTLKKSDRNRIEAFEMSCWRKMLSISWQEHHTNDSILTELGLERELMGRVAKLKLQYFGRITRGSAGQLALTDLEGIMEGLRHQGRLRRQ